MANGLEFLIDNESIKKVSFQGKLLASQATLKIVATNLLLTKMAEQTLLLDKLINKYHIKKQFPFLPVIAVK